VRSGPQHFTYSKIMAWVAFDRAIQSVERFNLSGPVDRWRRVRAEIHDEVCSKGYDRQQEAFTQRYGAPELDASALLIPLVGFLPPSDRRVGTTVEAIKGLMLDGLVRRYDPERTQDGLSGGEGHFSLAVSG
jgi:GH15 family glucan-1,4-alpha-glucosidase